MTLKGKNNGLLAVPLIWKSDTKLPLDGSRVIETTPAASERSKRRRRSKVLVEPEEGGSPSEEFFPGCERA